MEFFHERNDYKEVAHSAFEWIKKRRVFYKEPMTLTFGSKEDFVPLQAADVLAYESNKRIRDFARPERRAWKVLASTQRVRTLRYDKSNIKHLIGAILPLV